VPAQARWDANEGAWQLDDGDLDRRPRSFPAAGGAVLSSPLGLLGGAVRIRAWWPDGAPKTVVARAGMGRAEALFRLHPDGALYRVGPLLDGVPHGTHRAYGSDGESPEALQVCCVPPGAWQLVQTYRRGEGQGQAWYDRAGLRLLGNGAPFPERPAGVPLSADYNELSGFFQDGVPLHSAQPTGKRRSWDLQGVLRFEEELVAGQHHGRTRVYDAAGRLLSDAHFAHEVLDGPHAEWPAAGPEPHFGLPRVAGTEGQCRAGQAVGRWRYLDADGREVARRELGSATAAAALTREQCPALADGARTPEAWRALGQQLHADGRFLEAVIAMARAAAAAASPAPLAEALAAWTVALAPGPAADQARALVKSASGDLALLLDGIRRGADPAFLLWTAGRGLSSADRAALDLVNAAILLRDAAPDDSPADPVELLVTRALMLGALGEPEAALRDADAVAPLSADQAEFLRLFVRVYFPRFDFWPAEEALTASPADPELAPAQSLDEINRMIGRLATRLTTLRERLGARVPDDVAFMVPSLTELLPDGPVPLGAWSFTLTAAEYSGDDADAGGAAADLDPHLGTDRDRDGRGADVEASDPEGELPATVEIRVDEQMGLPGPTDGLLALMRRARADWAALTWLCWAVGLDRPALATEIRPPATYARAALTSMERAWRCRDKRNSGGLLALTKGIAGFDWAGTAIDFVPSVLVEVAIDEYLEVRAVFTWLCDPFNRSLWQADLREGP
jgi:hypothetical protein